MQVAAAMDLPDKLVHGISTQMDCDIINLMLQYSKCGFHTDENKWLHIVKAFLKE